MRRFFTATFKWAVRLLAALFVLLVLVYWVLLTANWRDDPLTPEAQQVLAYTLPSEAHLQDNGFVILLGMDAPLVEGEDAVTAAMARGRQRLSREVARWQWLQTQRGVDATDEALGAPPSLLVATATGGVPTSWRCGSQPDCFAWYSQHQSELQEVLFAQQGQLSRLQAAAGAPRWGNAAPLYLYMVMPPYALLLQTHELGLAQATLLWQAGKHLDALTAFEASQRLSHRLFENADTLVTQMVGLAMIYREQRWAGNALQYMVTAPPDALARVQAQLAEPIQADWERVYAGEARFSAAVSWSLGWDMFSPMWTEKPSALWRGLNRLSHVAYLPGQTTNRTVANMRALARASAVPAPQLEQAFEAHSKAWRAQLNCKWWNWRNWQGRCMLGSPFFPSMYQSHAQRVTNVAAHRRLVRLQASALAQQVPEARVADWLARSPADLRNPYTEQPMAWDAATSSLVFEGREQQRQNPDGLATYRVPLGLAQPAASR